MIDALVVDANPMLSALLGGRAREILFERRFAWFSPQTTLFEVEKYLPFVARKLNLSELNLFREFELLPVTAVQPLTYECELVRATELIGWRDPKDVPVLASWRLGVSSPATLADLDRGGFHHHHHVPDPQPLDALGDTTRLRIGRCERRG